MRQREQTAAAPMLGVVGTGADSPGITLRGILRPLVGLERFRLSRVAAPDDLAAFAPVFWTVKWDLPEGETYEQEVLPFPCVNLACEGGEYRVHGPGTGRYVAKLAGHGWVTGARFTPAGFWAFSRRPMRDLVDRVAPAREITGREPPSAPSTPAAALSCLTTYLREHKALSTPTVALVDRLVDRAQTDASVVRVDTLAEQAGVSVRSLHRLFERYVGVSSKWIVRRARVQEAAERVARGERVNWAFVAQQLGYHDQAHLIRDFRAQIGETPAVYAKSCGATGD
jgi:AraC-like DNA-binding protein